MSKLWTARGQARHRTFVSAALVALAAFAAPVEAQRVTSVDVGDERIVVRFDDNVRGASSFILAGPDRIAIDVAGAAAGRDGAGAGPVARIRQARFADDTARIVLDMTEPRAVISGRFSADGRALTLDLAPLVATEVADAVAAPRRLYRPPTAALARPRSRYSVSVGIPAPRPGVRLPRIAGPEGRPLVVIDAGHGGHDPGAIAADGTREKDLTLALAKSIRDQLLAAGRVRVALTREDDRFLVLGERTAIARAAKADLFISVHADSGGAATSATGATIYTLSEVASSRTAAQLAARENRADVLNGVNLGGETSDVSSILIDLAQRETMNASARFAGLVKREGGDLPFKRDYHQMAGFAVLKAPDTPSILLEAGYITNPQDLARMKSAQGKRQIGEALRRAIDIHFARRTAAR
jgi:N-acetylmuramoyl-L-alanine amidase